MNAPSRWDNVRRYVRPSRAQFRFALRVALATLLAFALAQVLTIPSQGLWVILTSVLVTQMSVGASIRATAEFVVGTLGGVIYASAIAFIIPHENTIAMAGLLALTIAPLALAAALNPIFRVAPITGVLVLLISGQLGESPVEAAVYRLIEVMLGGAIGVMVSLLVLPERARQLELEAGAHILDQMAQALSRLLAGVTGKLDTDKVQRIQNEIGQSITGFQAYAAESRSERLFSLVARPDPGPLSQTFLRLRHDLIIIGRAAVAPLPDKLGHRLRPLLERIAKLADEYLHDGRVALVSCSSAPSLDQLKLALAAYASEIKVLRGEGAMGRSSISELERLFTLGFALEQLEQSFSDLEHCLQQNAPN